MRQQSVNRKTAFTITLDTDPNMRSAIADATGLETRWFPSESAFRQKGLTTTDPVAVFLDVTFEPHVTSDHHLIPKMKDSWPLCPVILTAGERYADSLPLAMALGADDFILKPIRPDELQSRMQVRLKAIEKIAERETLQFEGMTIDTLQKTVATDRGHWQFPATEIHLLAELAKAGGSVVPREELKSRCWPQVTVSDNALNRKLYELRRRLKPIAPGLRIRAIYGKGIVLEENRPQKGSC